MANKPKRSEYFIYVPELRIYEPVSEEVYKEYYRPIWRTFKKEHYHKRCSCPGQSWHLCCGDCCTCSFHTAGDMLSMDMEMGDSEEEGITLHETLADESQLIESIVEDAILLEELLHALEELDPEGKKMCRLIMEGCSERQAADMMNMARSTFKRHWDRVKEILAERLKDYK